MGRFTGGFKEVSEPDPTIFLECTGMKGSCLGSDDNVLLEVSGSLRGFVWEC